MRILMLNNEFPPLGGGQAVVNSILLRQYESIDNLLIDVVTGGRSASEYEEVTYTKNSRVFFVPIGNKNIHHSTGIELCRFFFRGLRKASSLCALFDYDLILAFSAVPAGAQALLLARKFKIPFVVRSPGVDIPGFEDRYKILYPFLTPIIHAVWRKSRSIIVSSDLHGELVRRALPEVSPKVVSIVNGVDTDVFTPGDRYESPTLICVARLIERKGIELLLSAFQRIVAKIPRARLLLVGTGDSEHKLKSMVASLQLAHAVEFRGFVPRDQMPDLYKESSIFILPSLNEGMSNAAVEALASGLPLILTDVGGAKELIPKGENGRIVPPGDLEGLTKAMSELIEDPQLREKMGRSSRMLSASFDWNAISKVYLGLIEREAHKG